MNNKKKHYVESIPVSHTEDGLQEQNASWIDKSVPSKSRVANPGSVGQQHKTGCSAFSFKGEIQT